MRLIERAGVRQVAVVQEEAHAGLVRVPIDVVETLGVEGARSAG